ncbi:MAG: GNAT family N-acetyltransferase [Sphingobium sp.]
MTLPCGWRPMKDSDIAAVSTISDAVHGPFTEDADIYAERLALYAAGCFVLERQGRVSGYLVTHPWTAAAPPALNERIGAIPADADCYYLHDLALLPDARGGGAGSAAMRCVVQAARAAGQAAIVHMAVGGAEAFWGKQGFDDISRELDPEKRASYGPDAVFMRRMIRTMPD